MLFLYILFESLILALSLSTDAFAASVGYGAGKIKISNLSCFIISLVCTGMLGVSLIIGAFFSQMIPLNITRWLCFILLLSMGVFRLFDQWIKNYIRKNKKIKLRAFALDLHFVLTVYANAEIADADYSKNLSAKEAVTLATALSLDGLAVGFGAAVYGGNILLPIILSFALTISAVKLGYYFGSSLQKSIPFDLSYLSGLLLITLAFLRL